ncbi:MAG: hypothetical protein GWO08_19260, partial [Gammaproteobacteria bacterium]|nr:hypothetical protein [Gammaproteobacteria bacterium]NIR95696.1 hypothetical protein [Gammaproteobacteria bacterium]
MSIMQLHKPVLTVILLLISQAVPGQTLQDDKVLKQALDRLDTIESELKRSPEQEQLSLWVTEVSQLRSQANDCITRLEQTISGLDKDIKSLGEKV